MVDCICMACCLECWIGWVCMAQLAHTAGEFRGGDEAAVPQISCARGQTITDLQILGCELHQNAFGGRAPPTPSGGAIALPQTP